MKKLIISSVAALSIIGGGLFAYNETRPEPIKVEPERVVWGSGQTVFNEPAKVVEITATPVEPKEIETAPTGNYTTKTIPELMAEKAPRSFDLHSLLYRLKYKFPERFTPERINESIDFVLSKFDLSIINHRTMDILVIEQSIDW